MSGSVRTAVTDEHDGAGSSIATSPEVAARPVEREASREEIEIDLLVEGIYRLYGFDFRDYSRSSLRRRVRHAVETERVDTISALQDRILHNRECFERVLPALSVNVSAMFRDPSFFLAFRRHVVPLLRTYPFARIWQAGCSTGEEVYSLAILLEEERLLDRCRVYATDMNGTVLRTAKTGIYPLDAMQKHTQNYIRAGGTRSFSEYYTARYDHAMFHPALQRNVLFTEHNLATDGLFNEFNVILCRNVMIYFNKQLQARVHQLFHDSLVPFGILGIGSHESLRFTVHESSYERLAETDRLYRRVR
jgi:chemotaxis protein methyltransferase CheR